MVGSAETALTELSTLAKYGRTQLGTSQVTVNIESLAKTVRSMETALTTAIGDQETGLPGTLTQFMNLVNQAKQAGDQFGTIGDTVRTLVAIADNIKDTKGDLINVQQGIKEQIRSSVSDLQESIASRVILLLEKELTTKIGTQVGNLLLNEQTGIGPYLLNGVLNGILARGNNGLVGKLREVLAYDTRKEVIEAQRQVVATFEQALSDFDIPDSARPQIQALRENIQASIAAIDREEREEQSLQSLQAQQQLMAFIGNVLQAERVTIPTNALTQIRALENNIQGRIDAIGREEGRRMIDGIPRPLLIQGDDQSSGMAVDDQPVEQQSVNNETPQDGARQRRRLEYNSDPGSIAQGVKRRDNRQPNNRYDPGNPRRSNRMDTPRNLLTGGGAPVDPTIIKRLRMEQKILAFAMEELTGK